jgi:hypothetical protein
MAAPQQPSDVQVQPNSTGQAIETVLVIQVGTGLTVGRQVMALGDPNQGANVANVTTAGQLQITDIYNAAMMDLLIALTSQVMINNQLMVDAFNLKDDLTKLDQQNQAALKSTFQAQVSR